MSDIIKIEGHKGEKNQLDFYPCHQCGCGTRFGFLHEPCEDELVIRRIVCQCGATISLEYE